MTKYGILSTTDRTAELGVNLQRKKANLLSPRKGDTKPCVTNMVAGLQTDLKKYRSMLRTQYDAFLVKPELLIIENEENNRIFYKGTASQYIDQLTIACAEFPGMAITNGGLTKTGLLGLLYETLPTDAADALRKRWGLQLKSADFIRSREYCRECLNAYKGLPLAGVNVHWYAKNVYQAIDIGIVIEMVENMTGKSVLTTEIGSYVQEATLVNVLLDMCNDMPYVIFNANVTSKSYGLYGDNKKAWLEWVGGTK